MLTVKEVQADASVLVNGPALRFVRRAKGRTVPQLARAAGVSTSFLAALERGARRGARTAVLRRVVDELGLDDVRVLLVDPFGPSRLPWTVQESPDKIRTSTTEAA